MSGVAARASGPAAVLEAVALEKRFGGVRALREADLALIPGRIHALLGQNGSGKSTLLRILSGQIAPDAGFVRIDGRPVKLGSPAQALDAGVAIVSQELTLAPDLSVMENICLARRERRRWYGIDWRAMRSRATAVLETLGLSIDLATPVGELRPDQQQLVEIGRAVSTGARILILDEPTSSLSDDEVEHLFSLLRTLRERGVAIALVTHRTAEVFAVVDEVTVLRDGQVVVASAPLADLEAGDLVRLMTGMEPGRRETARDIQVVGEPVLRLRRLTVPRVLDGIELDVTPGEIVGLAGLMGSGRSELLGAVFGTQASVGEILVGGDRLGRPTPRRAIAAGVAYVPAERASDGLVLEMSVRDNLVLASSSPGLRLRRPARNRERQQAEDALRAFQIVAGDREQPASTLSGGNQQKLLLAKWLATHPRVLLLDEPTRGVDVGAKAEIHGLLARTRDEGVGILISSSEASELRALCDRVIVLHRGRIAAQLAGRDVTEATVLRHAMG